jgi:hypothetical protein
VNASNKIFVVVGASALIYFLFKKFKMPESSTPGSNSAPNGAAVSDAVIVDALKRINAIYGKEKTKKLEQLFRNETRHFTSGQFKGTFSPGMEPAPNTNRTYPYGWSSLKNFAIANNIPASSFYIGGPYTEGGTGRQKYFVGFPNLYTSMLFVMYVIEKRGWNFGKWFSFNESSAQHYNEQISKIIPRITNTF